MFTLQTFIILPALRLSPAINYTALMTRLAIYPLNVRLVCWKAQKSFLAVIKQRAGLHAPQLEQHFSISRVLMSKLISDYQSLWRDSTKKLSIEFAQEGFSNTKFKVNMRQMTKQNVRITNKGLATLSEPLSDQLLFHFASNSLWCQPSIIVTCCTL